MEGLNNKQFSKIKENFLWLVRLEKKQYFKKSGTEDDLSVHHVLMTLR